MTDTEILDRLEEYFRENVVRVRAHILRPTWRDVEIGTLSFAMHPNRDKTLREYLIEAIEKRVVGDVTRKLES